MWDKLLVSGSELCHTPAMRLDIDSLRAFRTIVESGSFTAAASRLYCTQSAVSWKIKRLEERLGHPLLVRGNKGVTLTDVGQNLLVHAERILDAHDAAVASLELSELSGTIRLGCNDEPVLSEMADILRGFELEHPKVKIHTTIALSSVIQSQLRDGELDLALIQVIGEQKNDDDLVLRKDMLSWCVSPDLVLDDDHPVPLVTYGPRCTYRPVAEEHLRASGRESKVSLECSSSTGVIDAVVAGIGVTLLNRSHPAAPPEHKFWQDHGLPDTLPPVDFVARRSSRTRDPAVRALEDALVAGVQDGSVLAQATPTTVGEND